MKKFTVSCIGAGQRGHIYLSLMFAQKDKFELASLCDKNIDRQNNFINELGFKKESVFTDENEFFKAKRSDLIVITTQDKDHVGHIIKALKAGYKNILVEKPFATTFEEIKSIEEECEKSNAHIYVCHVLRYAPAFLLAKQYIDEGRIGKLMSIDGLERVGLLHQAFSYVRGNYSNKETSSPMIMAKCCHDLDLMVWYADSLCDYLSSIGSLRYFIKENKPVGASDRCFNCNVKETCHFNAYEMYTKYMTWAKEYVTDVRPVTDEAITEALKTSKYGTCVFNGNNNVVDNQIVQMKFKNDVDATLRMTAFTPFGGRRYHFYGTEGDIILDESLGTFVYRNKEGAAEEKQISTLISAKEGHGGGDKGLIESLYHMLCGEKTYSSSTLEYSIESHKMALYAEESRLQEGKKIKL